MRSAIISSAGLIGAAILLSACATLNEDQCKATSWSDLGFTDGARGSSSAYVSQHQSACTKFGISVDTAQWQSGWERGIRTFCTPANGVAKGKSGALNNNVCPADLAVNFNEGHRVGKQVHDRRRAVASLQSEIEADIRALADTPEAERPAKQLIIEVKRNRMFTLQSELNRAEREADLFLVRITQSPVQ